MSARDEYIAKMKAELDSLNAKMKELEQSAVEATAQAKVKFAEEMESLKTQSAEAREKFEALRDEGIKNWESMISDMDKVRDAFVHSVHYFKSQLKK